MRACLPTGSLSLFLSLFLSLSLSHSLTPNFNLLLCFLSLSLALYLSSFLLASVTRTLPNLFPSPSLLCFANPHSNFFLSRFSPELKTCILTLKLWWSKLTDSLKVRLLTARVFLAFSTSTCLLLIWPRCLSSSRLLSDNVLASVINATVQLSVNWRNENKTLKNEFQPFASFTWMIINTRDKLSLTQCTFVRHNLQALRIYTLKAGIIDKQIISAWLAPDLWIWGLPLVRVLGTPI